MLSVWMATEDQSPLERAMTRFAGGEDGALGDVYDLASPAVFTFLLRMCRDRSLAEDLTQETFLRIHRARGLYRVGAAVLPWAYTIARRLFLDAVRARRIEGKRAESPGDDDDAQPLVSRELAAPGPSAEELLADVELARAVDQALGKLPETQATAFRLLKGEGFSVAEVATVMGTTKGAVKLRAHRAYLALRGHLGGQIAASTSDVVRKREQVEGR